MTDRSLSPAAEAVLHAVTLKRYDVPYYACPKSIGQISSDVAAALRATADQIEDLYCDGDLEDSPGIVFALRQLMLIANELEAQ